MYVMCFHIIYIIQINLEISYGLNLNLMYFKYSIKIKYE